MTGARTLTILFTDVVGSTQLMSALPAREAEKLRQTHFGALRGRVGRHRGREIKNLGDGLMVAFESARAAIECGVAMQQAVAADAGSSSGKGVSIRVGIGSGDVREERGDCFGAPVVEASRLCAQAQGGQVLVADSARLLVRDYEPLRDAGELELKGLPEPTKAWEAVWSQELPAQIRVVLADDAVLVREGIAQILENSGVEVVAQAGDGEELLQLIAEHQPDVAIVDVRMPPTHTVEGLEAAMRIRDEYPETGVLVLSQEVQPRYAQRLLAASPTGVGYMLKERVRDVREFVQAARRVADGGTAFEPELLAGSRQS